jgi:hypothetical protein
LIHISIHKNNVTKKQLFKILSSRSSVLFCKIAFLFGKAQGLQENASFFTIQLAFLFHPFFPVLRSPLGGGLGWGCSSPLWAPHAAALRCKNSRQREKN